MNQTKKRLTIINLAISMTDDETIGDQIEKLSPLKSDEKLQEILSLLRAQNYGQAQRHIQIYLDTDDQNIVQRTLQEEEPTIDTQEKPESIMSQKEQDIIDQFDLFITSPEPEEEEKKTENIDEIMIDDFLSSLPEKKQKTMPSVDFNALLNINIDDVIPNNIELDESSTSSDTFFKDKTAEKEPEKEPIDTQIIKKDNFFKLDNFEMQKEIEEDVALNVLPLKEEIVDEIEDIQEELTIKMPDDLQLPPEIPMDDISVPKVIEPISFESTDIDKEDQDTIATIASMETTDTRETVEDFFDDALPPPIPVKKEVVEKKVIKRPVVNYKPISYIDEKFASMKTRYPSTELSDAKHQSVALLTQKIKEDGYTEEEIEETIDYINIIRKEGKHNEASELLILCACTESKFGQFMLARELFKGQIVEKNMSESFSMMNSLALEGFPEAQCDLGQFYENGLGIYKDVKKAGYLYKEAMENGIQRAEQNYLRISQQYKKLFK